MVYVFENEKGRKTYLHSKHDDNGAEIWSAFIGARGGNLKHWKTYKRAKQEMEKKGWKEKT